MQNLFTFDFTHKQKKNTRWRVLMVYFKILGLNTIFLHWLLYVENWGRLYEARIAYPADKS